MKKDIEEIIINNNDIKELTEKIIKLGKFIITDCLEIEKNIEKLDNKRVV